MASAGNGLSQVKPQSQEKTKACPYCFGLYSPKGLGPHKRKCELYRSSNPQCNICHSKFKDQFELFKHVKRTHIHDFFPAPAAGANLDQNGDNDSNRDILVASRFLREDNSTALPSWLHVGDEQAVEVYFDNRRSINMPNNLIDPIIHVYNIPIESGDVSPDDLETMTLDVFWNEKELQGQHTAYKMKISFGFILGDVVHNNYIYYYPAVDNAIISEDYLDGVPVNICTFQDVQNFNRYMRSRNILEDLVLNRPNTSYNKYAVVQVMYTLYQTDYPLGHGGLEFLDLEASNDDSSSDDQSGGSNNYNSSDRDFIDDGSISSGESICYNTIELQAEKNTSRMKKRKIYSTTNSSDQESECSGDCIDSPSRKKKKKKKKKQRKRIIVVEDSSSSESGGELARSEGRLMTECSSSSSSNAQTKEKANKTASNASQQTASGEEEEEEEHTESEDKIDHNETQPVFRKKKKTQKIEDYVLKSKYIKTLLKEPFHNKLFNDVNCVFRAAAYATILHNNKEEQKKYGHNYFHRKHHSEIEQLCSDFRLKWLTYTQLEPDEFRGINAFKEIGYLENLLQIKFNVFTRDEFGTANVVYLSCIKTQIECNIVMANNHACLILDKGHFLARYRCDGCSKLFRRFTRYKEHQGNCQSAIKRVFPVKAFKLQPTLFEELRPYGIDIYELYGEEAYYKYLSVFDYETYQSKIPETQDAKLKKLRFLNIQKPLSVSITSNVEGFQRAKTIIKQNDEHDITEDMIDYLYEIQSESARLTKLQFLALRYFFQSKLSEIARRTIQIRLQNEGLLDSDDPAGDSRSYISANEETLDRNSHRQQDYSHNHTDSECSSMQLEQDLVEVESRRNTESNSSSDCASDAESRYMTASSEMDSSSEKENINNPPSNQSCSSSDGEVLEKTRVNDCNPVTDRTSGDEPSLSSGSLDGTCDSKENTTDDYREKEDYEVAANWNELQLTVLEKLNKSIIGSADIQSWNLYQCNKGLVLFQTFIEKLSKFIVQHCVLGFNSQKFDLLLARPSLIQKLGLFTYGRYTKEGDIVDNSEHVLLSEFKPFVDNANDRKSVLKKGSGYMVLSNARLVFLDALNFLSAGTSLRTFIESYSCSLQKSYFPYDILKDDYKHVLQKDISTLKYECFFTPLRQMNVLDEEYQKAKAKGDSKLDKIDAGPVKFEKLMVELRSKGISTIEQYLIWYNELDVIPFLECLEKMMLQYRDFKIQLFKNHVSLPSVARTLMARSIPSHIQISLVNEELWKKFKRHLVGGASQVFLRVAQGGVTKLPEGDEIMVGALGLDANALYGGCIGGVMPCGSPIYRRFPNFTAKYYDYYKTEKYYLDYRERKTGYPIQRQVHYYPYILDGQMVIDGSPLGLEYLGCYIHFHTINGDPCPKLARILSKIEDPSKKERVMQKGMERKVHHEKKMAYLKALGLPVICYWECYVSQDMGFRQYVKKQHRSCFDSIKHRAVYESDIIDAVHSGSFFGFLTIDGHFDKATADYLDRFPVFFANIFVPFSKWGSHMSEWAIRNKINTDSRRLLVSGNSAKKIMINSDYLKWLLDKGLVVTRIYYIIEFERGYPFASFMKQIVEQRTLADKLASEEKDPQLRASIASKANIHKALGNSAFGSLLLNALKQKKTSFVNSAGAAAHLINNPRFRSLKLLGPNTYEVSCAKSKYVAKFPIQLGIQILLESKLTMISFYWDFIDKYTLRSLVYPICGDTDSIYLAIARGSLKDCVHPHLKEDFEIQLRKRFVTGPHNRRTPKLMHLEWYGDCVIAACSKLYIAFSQAKPEIVGDEVAPLVNVSIDRSKQLKTSARGIILENLQSDILTTFMALMNEQQPQSCVNTGFRTDPNNSNMLSMYSQLKHGFSYLYIKRTVDVSGIYTRSLSIPLCPEAPNPDRVDKRLKVKESDANYIYEDVSEEEYYLS